MLLPSHSTITLPRLTVSGNVQQVFSNLDYQTRLKIFLEMKNIFEKHVERAGKFQEELEKCETLVQLGASNPLILNLLPNVEEQDVVLVRKKYGMPVSGRIYLLPYKNRHTVYQKWVEIFQQYKFCTDEFDRWILLADCFPKYSLGQLHKAVQVAEQEFISNE